MAYATPKKNLRQDDGIDIHVECMDSDQGEHERDEAIENHGGGYTEFRSE